MLASIAHYKIYLSIKTSSPPTFNTLGNFYFALVTMFVSNPFMLRRCVVFVYCKLDLLIKLCNQLATTNCNRVVVLKWVKCNEIQCIKYSHNSLLISSKHCAFRVRWLSSKTFLVSQPLKMLLINLFKITILYIINNKKLNFNVRKTAINWIINI